MRSWCPPKEICGEKQGNGNRYSLFDPSAITMDDGTRRRAIADKPQRGHRARPKVRAGAFKRSGQPRNTATVASIEIAGFGRVRVRGRRPARCRRILSKGQNRRLGGRYGRYLWEQCKNRGDAHWCTSLCLHIAAASLTLTMPGRGHAGCHGHLAGHLACMNGGQTHAEGQKHPQHQHENPSIRPMLHDEVRISVNPGGNKRSERYVTVRRGFDG